MYLITARLVSLLIGYIAPVHLIPYVVRQRILWAFVGISSIKEVI
ncbi:hypothetical protein SAMN05444416_11424 [Thermoactinomyces sp. DSM 45892]|nr:hypothetical protein SAMN05444416_11424 [Thermoactinomyces sp. DSM 45892]